MGLLSLWHQFSVYVTQARRTTFLLRKFSNKFPCSIAFPLQYLSALINIVSSVESTFIFVSVDVTVT